MYKCTKRYVNRKFRNKISNKIDTEVRVVFTTRATTGLIKIVSGYNHYRQRQIMINKIGITSTYPRYTDDEDWEYVILCHHNEQ